jgi:predicted alpha/beta hydrolase family esterase
VARLEDAVVGAAGRVVLVAHSLGCALVAHWAQSGSVALVAGALLVAPPDVEEIRHYLPEIESFVPLPMTRLPFASVVVASATDPYVDPARARAFAAAWGARLVDLGDAGHINADAGFHAWEEGRALLHAFGA